MLASRARARRIAAKCTPECRADWARWRSALPLRGQGLALMAGIVIAGISAAVNSQLAAILAILGDPLDRSGFLIV